MLDNEQQGQKLKFVQNLIKPINQYTFRGQFSEPNQLSSSILQQTNPQLSFPRAERFQSQHASSLPSPKYLSLSDTKSKRATSFGFGNKQLRPLDLEKRDILNPAPGQYETKQASNRSCSFGLKLSQPQTSDGPGPGSYNIKQFSKGKAFSIYGKINSEVRLPNKCCSAAYLLPNDKIVQNNRFSHISFGFGERPLPSGLKQQYPGPGAYLLKSVFDINKKQQKHQTDL